MADESDVEYPILRAEAYGPSQGEYNHDQLYGPLGKLADNDIAVSPDQLSRYPLGSFVDIYQGGQLVRANQRVADKSYKSPGVPNTNTFEVWNGQDLGHAELRPSSSSPTQEDKNEQAFERYVGGAYEPIEEPQAEPAPSPESEQEDSGPAVEDNILSPKSMVNAIRYNYSAAYGHYTDDQIYSAFKQKFPTPMLQLRALSPKFNDLPDDEFQKRIHLAYFPHDTDEEFKDRINPPQGMEGVYKNFMAQMPALVPDWNRALASVAQFPNNLADTINQFNKKIGYPALPMGHIAGMTEFAKRKLAEAQQQESQHPPPEPKGIAGQVGQVAAGLPGAALESAPAFLPGGTAARLVTGMLYEGVQAGARARESKMDNAIAQGAEAVSYRGIQEMLLTTPRGWLTSGLLWGLAAWGDRTAKDWLEGKDTPIGDMVKVSAVNGLFGAIASIGVGHMSKAAQESLAEANAARGRGDYEQAGALLDRTMMFLPEGDRKAIGNNYLKWRNEAVQETERPQLPAPSSIQIPQQEPTFEMGQGAGPYYTGELQTQVRSEEPSAQLALPAPKSVPLLADGPDGQAQNVFFGNGSRGKPEIQLPADVEKLFSRYPEARERFNRLPPEDQQQYLKHFENVQRSYASTSRAGEAGFVINPAEPIVAGAKAVGKAAKGVHDWWQDIWDPEEANEARKTSAAVLGREIGRRQVDRTRFINRWWKRQKLEDDIRFAYEADQRRAYWTGFSKGQLKGMLQNWESKSSTGNAVADKLLTYYDGLYKALSRFDQAHGLTYNVRDSYIPHILKNPEEIAKVENLIKRMKWGDPNFMHARAFDNLKALHAFGFELKTYNPEELFQMRLDSSLKARMQSNILGSLQAAHLAVDAQGMKVLPKQVQEEIKAQSHGQVYRDPGGSHETYWVHKDAHWMIDRALTPLRYPALIDPLMRGASFLKQRTVGLNLGLSGFHHLHMLPIGGSDSVALAMNKFLAGKGTASDWAAAIADLGSMGASRQIKSLRHAQKLMEYYKGNLDEVALSPDEQKSLEFQKRAGFTPHITQERQIQIMRKILGGAPKQARMADQFLSLGYNIISGQPYQRWLFGTAIPSMKMYSFDQSVRGLLDTNPELFRPSNRLKLDRVLRTIRNQVDAKYGEQNMDQMFVAKYLKGVGQTVMLSFSWMKSFLDVYGGAMKDLTSSAAHIDQVIDTFRKEGLGPAARRVLTNKVLYAGTLTAMTSLAGGLISQFIGNGIHSLQDFVYPNIGKNPDGTDRRVKPPFWVTTEIGGFGSDIEAHGGNWLTGTGQFFANKLQPALATMGHLITNQDYNTADISPHWDPRKDFWANWQEQIGTKLGYTASQMAPFSLQQSPLMNKRPGTTWFDFALGALGLPRAPKHAERSHIENEIVNEYIGTLPRNMSRQAADQIRARDEYRAALQYGDSDAAQRARDEMIRLGVSPKSIQDVERTRDIPTAERVFHKLPQDVQDRILREAQGEEREKFRKLASKKEQAIYAQSSFQQ